MTQNILLLEDDLELSDTIKEFLELNGYKVYIAHNIYQAENLAYENSIDLFLLDVKVPHGDGFEFLKKIRLNSNDVPAIFITSLNSIEDVEKGFLVGADDYIKKPFALKELLIRVKSLLKRSFNTHKDIIELGDGVVFDLKGLRLSKNNQKIALKTKELKLLALFLKHPNKLLTYDTIYEALWDYAEEPNNGSLRTYIKTLRASIGKKRIETVKNIGYRFVK